MRKHLVWVLGLALAVAVASVAVGAQTQTVSFTMKPTKQSKTKYGAVSINVTTTTGATTGGPGAIKPATRAQLKFDDDFQFFTRGLATCTESQLQNTTTAQAKQRCGSSQVGSGTAEAKIAGDPANPPVNVVVTAFNGKPQGTRPVLLLHSRTESLGFTTVLVGVLKNSSGDFGKELDVRVPTLPAGTALTKFQTKVQKSFTSGGQRRNYVSARCFDNNKTWNLSAKFTYQGAPSLNASDTVKCQVR
jgi:hypothetical protein